MPGDLKSPAPESKRSPKVVPDGERQSSFKRPSVNAVYQTLVRPLVKSVGQRLMRSNRPSGISRRGMLRGSALGAAGLAGAASVVAVGGRDGASAKASANELKLDVPGYTNIDDFDHSHETAGTVGEVDTTAFDPMVFLESFDYGRQSKLSDGRTLREYEVIAVDKDIEIAPGVFFPAWTYNGQVPGPTIRATAGDVVRIRFNNAGSHPHSIHFHGIHPTNMDGVFEIVKPGNEFTYEFEVQPWWLHLYHCHAVPLKRHIHKGLYGTFIIDPPQGRPPAREMVMVMNGFSTEFNGENTFYAVNTVAFHHVKHPIPVRVGELQRIYLTNLTEFDLINSFHLHADMFRVYRTGTTMDHYELTDTVMLCQGERHILEFTLPAPGMYMFHAHQSEFAELGWMGFFKAVEA